jgi:hypothetical protein
MDNTITRVTISSRFLEQWMIGVSSNLADFWVWTYSLIYLNIS